MHKATKPPRAGPVVSASRGDDSFIELGVVRPDPRGRLTLAKSKGETAKVPQASAYKQFVNQFGEILLIPIAEIPFRELWIHQDPSAMASLMRGIGQAAAGELHEVDLSEFADED